jgi:nucleoside-diphosphate-sugar epimerase
LNSKICVIGCGWLGFPLAKKLVELNYSIHGSTTSNDKLSQLKQAQIHPFLIQFSSEGVTGNLKSCLKDCQTLIVTIPPGLRKNPKNDYVTQMQHFLEYVEASSVEHVLFIGTTSVYDDDENVPVITENSPTSNDNIPTQLLKVEALFTTSKKFKTTILRFSGLFAEDRHPAKYLSGKTNLKNGDAPVNLIHRDDCIAIIISVVKKDIWNVVINASSPSHPSKKKYYTSICESLQLPIPEFDNASISKGKIIDSTKLVQLLKYDFAIKL